MTTSIGISIVQSARRDLFPKSIPLDSYDVINITKHSFPALFLLPRPRYILPPRPRRVCNLNAGFSPLFVGEINTQTRSDKQQGRLAVFRRGP